MNLKKISESQFLFHAMFKIQQIIILRGEYSAYFDTFEKFNSKYIPDIIT